MAKDKKVEQITDMEVDFAQWYTDVCKKAQLIDYSSVKGIFIYRPYGYAIWENIQHIMDAEFKKVGVQNVYMPMLIPESLLQKEKDHVEGFAPECAWVTMGGSEKLEERLCIRPTSETLFCDHFAQVIQSHRDLPMKYNQWCSVLRWEKTSRPFLRHREFLWQEGHTMHATAEEAKAFTEQMLNVYADFCEDVLAMPVTRGQKTEKEKFNGAEATYTIECMMHDRKPGVLEAAQHLKDRLEQAGFRVKVDDSDNSMGWKCAEYEMKGVPLRVECGPRDLENDQCVLVRRTDREKVTVKLEDLEKAVAEQLALVHQGMYDRAKKNLEDHIYAAHSLEEAKEIQEKNGGFVKTMWCGSQECELKMKEVAGMSSRCIPFKQEHLGDTCACCGKPASKMIYWGVAY